MRIYKQIITIISVCLFSCENPIHEETHEQHDIETKEASEHNHKDILIHSEHAKSLGITAETIKTGSFRESILVSGEILPSTTGQAVVVAKSSGIISFQNNLMQGIPVAKGSLICRISSSEMQGGDLDTSARIAYETAKAEYERLKPLYEEKIVGAKEYQDAKMAYEMSKNAYNSVNSSIIKSPISGIVSQLFVENGSFVDAGTPIAVVAETNRLILKAYLPQRYYSFFPTIRTANIKLPYTQTIYELNKLNGQRLSASNETVSTSGYIEISFSFNNNGAIVPGCYADIYLIGMEKKNVISVPVQAITEEEGYYFVYIKEDAEHYEKRKVEIGNNNGCRIEVLSGINEGEKVVIEGAVLVKLAANTGVAPESHHHH